MRSAADWGRGDGALRWPGMAGAMLAATITCTVTACYPSRPATGESLNSNQAASSPATKTASSAASDADAVQAKAQVRDALAALAKGASDRTQLAWYATSFLRHVDKPVADFAKDMGKQQQELLDELRRLARARGISLKFSYPDTIEGHGRALMEKAQGDEVQNASQADFQRSMLYMMYMNYKDDMYLAKATQEKVNDPELAAYLHHFVSVQEQGIKRLHGLLQQYKFTMPGSGK